MNVLSTLKSGCFGVPLRAFNAKIVVVVSSFQAPIAITRTVNSSSIGVLSFLSVFNQNRIWDTWCLKTARRMMSK